MSNLTRETIRTLSDLCRIECTEAEQERLLHDLKKILDQIDLLNEVDTEGVTPCSNVLEGMVNVTREDTISELLPRDTFLANSPAHVGGMVRVPPVIQGHQS